MEARWSNADEEQAARFSSILFRIMPVSIDRKSAPGFLPVAFDRWECTGGSASIGVTLLIFPTLQLRHVLVVLSVLSNSRILGDPNSVSFLDHSCCSYVPLLLKMCILVSRVSVGFAARSIEMVVNRSSSLASCGLRTSNIHQQKRLKAAAMVEKKERGRHVTGALVGRPHLKRHNHNVTANLLLTNITRTTCQV